MLVLGHRGFSGAYPENTMLAFEKAIEIGADGVELDVHFSRDGQLMVIHDEKLERTAGVPGKVSDYTAAELVKISAGKTFSDSFGFTPIPRFEEFCEFWKEKQFITNVEIKTNHNCYPGIEEACWKMISSYGLEKKVIFSSFNWVSTQIIRNIAPEVPCGLLYDGALPGLNESAKPLGYTYLHPDVNFVDAAFAEDCRKSGLGLNVWTVNSEEQIDKMLALKVNGIISNYPDRVLSKINR